MTDPRLLLTQEEEEGGSVLCAWEGKEGGKGAGLCLRLTAEGGGRPPSKEGGGGDLYRLE